MLDVCSNRLIDLFVYVHIYPCHAWRFFRVLVLCCYGQFDFYKLNLIVYCYCLFFIVYKIQFIPLGNSYFSDIVGDSF